jgi:hypothetical protein
MAIRAHKPAGICLRGVIAIDQGNLVAMPHGAQGKQKLGAKKGRDTDQHVGRTE